MKWELDFNVESLALKIISAEKRIQVITRRMRANPHKYTTQYIAKYLVSKTSTEHKQIEKSKLKLCLLNVPIETALSTFETYYIRTVTYSNGLYSEDKRLLDYRSLKDDMSRMTNLVTDSTYDHPAQTNKSKWKGESPYSSKSKWR